MLWSVLWSASVLHVATHRSSMRAAWPWSVRTDEAGRTFFVHLQKGWCAWRVPVGMEAVEGTPWCQVRLSDGNTYYFHQHTRERRWFFPREEKQSVMEPSVEEMQGQGEVDLDPDAYEDSEPEEPLDEEDLMFAPEDIEPDAEMIDESKEKETKRQQFFELLEEAKVTRFSFWKNVHKQIAEDPRCQALDKAERAKAFDAYLERLNAAGSTRKVEGKDGHAKSEREKKLETLQFRKMLKELGVRTHDNWDLWREELERDPRGKSVGSDAERKKLFVEYSKELEEAQNRVREKEKKRIAELERDRMEAERKRRKVAHQAAAEAFKTLLAEEIKDPVAEWEDWHPILADDLQRRADAIQFEEQRRLFKAHVQELRDRVESGFKQLLGEVVPPSKKESATWEGTKPKMATDVRFRRCPPSLQEALFQKHVDSSSQ